MNRFLLLQWSNKGRPAGPGASYFAGQRKFGLMRHSKLFPRLLSAIAIWVLLISFSVAFGTGSQTAQRSPTDTVRLFYKTMRERKFREAFAMSIYKPAVEGLSAAEFDDLRPDFEKMAAAIPDKVNINGEQVSRDTATVFVKVKEEDT